MSVTPRLCTFSNIKKQLILIGGNFGPKSFKHLSTRGHDACARVRAETITLFDFSHPSNFHAKSGFF